MVARLITIPFSHYCEKARWALERAGMHYVEQGHLPVFHYLASFPAGGGRTVPVLVVDGRVLADSTDIVAWADEHAPGSLLPTDADARAEALALEDEFDRQLGPATRRWAYDQLLPRRDLDHVVTTGVPRWERAALRVARPFAVQFLRRGLNITPDAVARSRAKIDTVFANVSERVRDGRKTLVGGALSVADITFAALAAPVLLPPDHPAEHPPIDVFTGEARAQIDAWRATPAGQFALQIYAEHRR